MGEEILKFTKITFLIHLILGALYTILYLMPEFNLPLYGLDVTATSISLSMTIGAAVAGLTVSSFFGYRAKSWKEVKILVINEIVWLAISIIVCIINFAAFNSMIAFLLSNVGFLFAIFLISFLKQEEIIKKK